jgi:hypothetical protein
VSKKRQRITNKKGLPSKRFVIGLIVLSIALLAANVGVIYWQLFPEIMQKVAVPLHYNIHSGVDQFGSWQQLFTIPAVGLAILVINLIGAGVSWKRERILSHFFFLNAVVCEAFLLLAAIFVVLLNLSYGIST